MEANVVIQADVREEKKPNGSRFNALKHGLTAKTAVLPGEDPEMFQARIDQYKGDIETRNGIEEDLAKNAALASWQVDRAASLRAARAKSASVKAAKSDADRLREDVEAAMLGNRLFHDRMGPIELYATEDYLLQQKRTSWDHENPDDPDHPAILVRRLCATVAGCRWLLKSWSELRDILKMGLGLQSHEKLKMLRLMGKQPINALGRPEVARVFLACHVLEPQFDYAFQELRSEMYVERFARFKELMERWEKIGIAPPNRMAARVVLLGIIDGAIEGLKGLEAQLQAKEDEDQRKREACPSDEDQKAGQQVERHQGSCNRLIFGNLNAIHKLRRNEADGWGKARQQREQKAQGKKKSTPVDHRSVVDERGVVRPAYGYDGDLEEGLARFEAEFGRSGLNKPWEEFEATHRRAVPDYARFVASKGREEGGLGGGETVTGEGGEVDRGVGGEKGFLGGEVASEQVQRVTEVLMETVCASDLQNEISGCPLSVVSTQLLDFDRADGTRGADAEGDGRANGTRSVPATGSGECGAAAEENGKADDGRGVAATGDGRANGTRSVPATGSGDCGAAAGVTKAGDGVKWPCARPGQREFLFGRLPRDSAGVSYELEPQGASRKRRLTGRYLKRDAKRWRKVAAKLEVIRRTGVASEAEVAAIRGSLDEHAFGGPNPAEVNHERLPRLP